MMTLILGWLGVGVGTLAIIAAVWFLGPAVIIAFFQTSIGRIIMAIAAVVVISLGIGQTFYNKAMRECAAANKQREIEIAKRDVKIGELHAALDQKNVDELNKEREKDSDFQRKLEEELAKRPVGERCNLTEPDRLRLR